jgi:hypothetical protein
VLVNGRPSAGISLVFHAVNKTTGSGLLVPRGTTDKHGYFVLSTYAAGDGAPQGEYRVTIVWRQPLRQLGRWDAEELHPDEEAALPNLLPSEYADPRTTPVTITVEPTRNRLEPILLRQAPRRWISRPGDA